MSISNKIFALLKEKHISQKEFSIRTGIAQSTISDWKKKGNNPSSDKIMIICSVLEISPYELLGEGDMATREVDLTSMEGQLLEAFSKIDESQKNRVLGYALAIADKDP